MKQLYPEEQIRSRLRQLTEETRRVREELREMIRKSSGDFGAARFDLPKPAKRLRKSSSQG